MKATYPQSPSWHTRAITLGILLFSAIYILISALLNPALILALEGGFIVLIIAGVWALYLTQNQLIWLLIFGLPLHSFVSMILYGRLHVPSSVITVLSTWKEGVALGAATIFIARALPTPLQRRLRLSNVDMLTLLFSAWLLARLAWANLDGSAVPLQAQVYGLRFYLIPLSLYAIGRLAPLSEANRERFYWMLAIVGGVTGAIAIFERIIPDAAFISLLRAIGYHDYYINYVNAPAMWGPGSTSASMWIYIGGRFIRRAGSIYMVSKPFAFSYLVILPLTLSMLWTSRQRSARRWLWVCTILGALGLLLSITRAPIVVLVFVGLSMAFLLKRWRMLMLVTAGGILILTLLISQPAIQTYLYSVGNASDSSTQQHLNGWIEGLTNKDTPWITGLGIGTSNQENARFNLDPTRYRLGVISESIYVQILQELGVTGLLLYLGLHVALIRRANRMVALSSSNPELFRTGLAIRWMTIAMLLTSFVAIPWQNALVTTYFYWLLVGQSAQMPLPRLPAQSEAAA